MTTGKQVDRIFSGARGSGVTPISDLPSEEGRAALRQFSLERLMAYGVAHADAMELRGRVNLGADWRSTATAIADAILSPDEDRLFPPSDATRLDRLRRSAALIRISQLMMVRDDALREDIQRRAVELYAEAALLSDDREALSIASSRGSMSAWLFPPSEGEARGCAIVIGGIEGWAMDFDGVALALAARGVETLMLDGPGQGSTRLLNHLYFTADWAEDYEVVIETMTRRHSGKRLAFIGNSMGGSLALHLARQDPRISACCSNGGLRAPGEAWNATTFHLKMAAHCGDLDFEEAGAIWRTVRPMAQEQSLRCPLLVVHGGLDPLVSDDDVEAMVHAARSDDAMVMRFSDGDHCVYNHADDKHALIADWVVSRLAC